MSDNKHVIGQRTTPLHYYGPPEPQDDTKKEKSDYLRIDKKVNGWNLILHADEFGEVSMTARKPLGRIRKSGSDTDSSIQDIMNLRVETTQHRIPAFKNLVVIGGSVHTSGYASGYSSGPGSHFVEVDDGKNITTETFQNHDRFYKRAYEASSVLTQTEFFTQLIPEFEQLLKDNQLHGYVSKIADSCSRVQKPYNRNYVLEK
jgi:hypothetical protein